MSYEHSKTLITPLESASDFIDFRGDSGEHGGFALLDGDLHLDRARASISSRTHNMRLGLDSSSLVNCRRLDSIGGLVKCHSLDIQSSGVAGIKELFLPWITVMQTADEGVKRNF